MHTIEQTLEEKNTKRVILLGSTFIVLVVSFIIAYMLISTEVKEFKNHLKTFKTTLLDREKSAIRAVVDNLINDILYEENSKLIEIQKRVKNQTIVAFDLIQMILSQNKHLSKNEAIKKVKEAIKKISNNQSLEFFIFDSEGTLIFQKNSTLPKEKNFIDLKDIDGEKFIHKIVNYAGFVNYLWFVPRSNKVSKKITYSKKIKELGIIIGSGEFLDTQHSLNKKILNKINQEKFGINDFIFIYEIMSLSSSKNYSKLILEKNIITGEAELTAIENILESSDYKGNMFYEYENKLTYSAFLFDDRTFISAGVDLNSIRKIIERETKISHANLNKKITFLVLNILAISIIFFIFSYFMAKKIEKMFKNYRLKIANSQQLLIQKSKMASMGEMIGNIAHQWRQPLTQLSGIFLDVETAHSHKELTQKYLEKRTDEANDLLEYMSKTIDDFKEFYNPNIEEKNFNLRLSIYNAIKIVNSSLKFYNIHVHVKVDKSLHVKGQSNEFSQVILNLISNAKDVALKREIIEPKIEISAEKTKNNIYLHVEDNCGGIEKDILEKIFEPYFTTKYTYGTGIGLYMCKIIIESKMGGKISATDKDSNGALFTIILPK
jgi:signal transduction histidine kinase